MTIKDFRGNEYQHGELLFTMSPPTPVICEWPECEAQAVRHYCNAEGKDGRTHHHGGIHRLDNGPGFLFCPEHGNMVLSANEGVGRNRSN